MITLKPIKELGELLSWRKEVIENVFGESPSEVLMKANEDFYRRHITDGTHLAFVALDGTEEAGCGGICLTEELPSPDNHSGKCGYLMNIYVREKFRQHGIGHQIVKKLIEEAQNRNCNKIYLETTAEGRPVYESLGFRDLPDMMKLESKSRKS